MKLFKAMICFFVLILSLFGAITIYGQQNQTQWIDKFIESFEMTESNFKFYNIKSSIIIEKEMDMNQLKDICTEIAKNLGDGHGELSSKMQKGEIYVNYDDEDKGISIVGVKKNSKEFYIIVEYTNKLNNAKISAILEKILYNMYAEKIDDIEEENFLSVNAYSKLLKENNLKYLDREMNLNIGIRYSEDDDRTTIYMATPIIKIDY